MDCYDCTPHRDICIKCVFSNDPYNTKKVECVNLCTYQSVHPGTVPSLVARPWWRAPSWPPPDCPLPIAAMLSLYVEGRGSAPAAAPLRAGLAADLCRALPVLPEWQTGPVWSSIQTLNCGKETRGWYKRKSNNMDEFFFNLYIQLLVTIRR